jgi:hypothetical protein
VMIEYGEKEGGRGRERDCEWERVRSIYE